MYLCTHTHIHTLHIYICAYTCTHIQTYTNTHIRPYFRRPPAAQPSRIRSLRNLEECGRGLTRCAEAPEARLIAHRARLPPAQPDRDRTRSGGSSPGSAKSIICGALSGVRWCVSVAGRWRRRLACGGPSPFRWIGRASCGGT